MLFLLLTVFAAGNTRACDICGCGAGSTYLGVLPDFSTRIIGLRYRYNNLLTHVGPGGSNSYLTTREQYHTAELWGGWTFGQRFRIMASVPLSYNTKSSQEKNASKTGPGDITLQGLYRVVRSKRSLGSRLLAQDLWLGGGVKLPVGQYEPLPEEEAGKSANLFQLGTGSTDFLLTGMYDIRLQDAGLNLSAGYKMNTTNRYGYNYGNKLSTSMQVYYKFRIRKTATLAPNAGLAYERASGDLDEGYAVFNSGGYLLAGTLGAELQYKKVALGGNWQPPLKQQLAMDAVRARNRMMFHLSLMF